MNFKIVNNNTESVLLEVLFENTIDKMSNKGFSGAEKFIKYTKGNSHRITVYDSESKVIFGFDFGEGGSTVISEDTKVLKDKVYKFLLSNHIQPKNETEQQETKLELQLPKKGYGVEGHICIHLGGNFAIFLKTEEEIKELFGEYEIYNTYVAPTGVTVKQARLEKTKTQQPV